MAEETKRDDRSQFLLYGFEGRRDVDPNRCFGSILVTLYLWTGTEKVYFSVSKTRRSGTRRETDGGREKNGP